LLNRTIVLWLIVALLLAANWYMLDQAQKHREELAEIHAGQRALEVEMDDVKHVQAWQAQRMDDVIRWRPPGDR